MEDHHAERSKVIGTAGHIDHGKTALVRALTGIEPDRLPEEKRRGMTIDLGFAFLRLAQGEIAAIVDVPGHEAYIRNMLAGATGVDVALLVVAADDGVMPQTEEHTDILRFLDVRTMVCALTKVDLVDAETRTVAREEVEEFLQRAGWRDVPIVEVSSVTGEGLQELRRSLAEALAREEPRSRGYAFRLPVDRSFAPVGIGCVVTGTVWSGTAQVGDELEVLPQGRRVKVRQLQSHNRPVARIRPGQRAALNLAGIKAEELTRGTVLLAPGTFRAWPYLNVELTLLSSAPRPLPSFAAVRFHLGTHATFARVVFPQGRRLAPGDSAVCQLRLKEPVVASRGDRFVIRQESPVCTLGGGMVIVPATRRLRSKNVELFRQLEDLRRADLTQVIAFIWRLYALRPPSLEEVAAMVNESPPTCARCREELVRRGELRRCPNNVVLSPEAFTTAAQRICSALGSFHDSFPARPHCPAAELRHLVRDLPEDVFTGVVSLLKEQGRLREARSAYALAGHKQRFSEEELAIRTFLVESHRANPLNPPGPQAVAEQLKVDQAKVLRQVQLLVEEGALVSLGGGAFLTPEAIQRAAAVARSLVRSKGAFAVMDFRDALGTSRKYAVPLLEHLDHLKITVRRADNKRVLRER